MTVAEQILEALGDVGIDLVDMSEKQRFSGSLLRSVLPVAACAALLLTGGMLAHRYLTAPPGGEGAAAAVLADQSEAVGPVVEAVPDRVLLTSQSSPAEGDSRTVNLVLACDAIDGMVLEPGEEFSFNSAVGERTEEKGYVAASTYAGDDATSEIGGGIGQVASMLYCASLKLDLQQLERAGNTYAVSYVPYGFDAAVYWGVTDYRFANSLDTPVEIRAFVEDGLLTVELWGAPDESRSIALENNIVAENVVETYQVVYGENGQVSEKNMIDITTYETRE